MALGSVCGAASSGLLLLEIVCERIGREFDLDLISTAASVVYRFMMMDGGQC